MDGTVLTDDSTFAFGGTQWLLNYNDTQPGTNFTDDLTSGGTGIASYVTMTVVPESSAALLGIMGTLALLRRRR